MALTFQQPDCDGCGEPSVPDGTRTSNSPGYAVIEPSTHSVNMPLIACPGHSRARGCLHGLRQLSLLAAGPDRPQSLSHVDRLGRQRRRGGGPVITNAEAGYDWSTYPERLERAGISWKIYQDIGVGLTRQASGAGPTTRTSATTATTRCCISINIRTPCREPARRQSKVGNQHQHARSRAGAIDGHFREDVRQARLPKVSWIVAPEAYTEHPNWQPDYGSWYVSQVVDILASKPEVWSKMALFITYDEEGRLLRSPRAANTAAIAAEGQSTVETTNEIFAGNGDHPLGPTAWESACRCW